MYTNKSIRINFIMNFILTISNFIFPLITFPYVSRVLGAEGVGTVTFATSIINYFSMVGMLGIPTYGIRACAKIRDDKEKLEKTVQEIMLLNALVMIFSIIGLALSVILIDKLNQEKVLYLILSTTLLFNVLGVDWLYRSLEQYTYITIRSIIFKFISLVALLILVKESNDYVMYGGITVIAAVGSNLMNFINLRKFINLKPVGSLNLKQHLKPIMTFFLLNVSATIYLNVDTTLLGFIKGDLEVGYYSAATKIKQILVSVVTSLGAVLLPRLSYYYEEGKHEEFQRVVRKALNFVLVLSLPLLAYFTLMAKESIVFLSGQEFLPAVLPMQFIMPTVLFIGLSNLMGMQVLVPTNREMFVVYSTIVGALVDILINSVAIPMFGATGAAFAGSMAELSVTLVQLYVLRSLILPMFQEIAYVKISLALLISLAIVLLFKFTVIVTPFFSLAFTGILYFAIYGGILYLIKEDFTYDTVQSLLSRFKRS